MLNRAMVIGHVGADPEIRSTQDGRKVATFSLATSERWTDKASGERRERTEWHRIVVFAEGLVPVIERYVKKGSKLYVEGQMTTRKWTDQGGVDRYTTEIVLKAFHSQMLLLDRAERSPVPSENDYGTTRAVAAAASKRDEMDDEIPF